ncbi:hypothetical protein [Marinovum sp.]|uniref:hypothetical protein n=1 Tax=Marinovum sp. TaxID=2024839 RepID=UPI003A939FB3
MTRYDYKVVPAPSQGRRAKGVKGAEGRFAFALECVMNEMAGDGWEYVRAETLPSEERQGLSGKHTVFRNVLVFRRAREDEVASFEPRLLDPPKEIPVLDAARAMKSESANGDARFEDGAVTAEIAGETAEGESAPEDRKDSDGEAAQDAAEDATSDAEETGDEAAQAAEKPPA